MSSVRVTAFNSVQKPNQTERPRDARSHGHHPRSHRCVSSSVGRRVRWSWLFCNLLGDDPVKKLLVIVWLTALFFTVLESPVEARHRHHHRSHHATIVDANGSQVIIGGRPAGCPHAFCGCALRKYLGIDDVRLNLAAAWGRVFSHTPAKPGAVGVRPHHVLLLEAHVSGSVWSVRDFNSGYGLSRIHERDLRGFVFVDPHQKLAGL